MVLFLELIQALVIEAISIGLISHGHPLYIYDPLVQCNTSTGADDRNASGSSACNQGVGIALLVILAAAASVVPCVLYIFVYVTNPLPKIIKCDCQFTSSTEEHIYPEEHMSPIFASFENIHVRQFDIQKCIKHQYKCNYCQRSALRHHFVYIL